MTEDKSKNRPCATVRKLPFPITLPGGRVGSGHLVPDLSPFAGPRGFIRVPGGRRVKYGMIGFVGTDVGVADMLERWEGEIGPVGNRQAALECLEAYVVEVARFKLGNVVEVDYSDEGIPRLRKLRDAPPGARGPDLPE